MCAAAFAGHIMRECKPLSSWPMLVDTYYWVVEWDFKTVPVNESRRNELPLSSKTRIADVLGDVEFYLKIQKTSSKTFSLTLCRVLANPKDKKNKGIEFGVIFSMVGHRKTPEVELMFESMNEVSVTYNIDDMFNPDRNPWIVRYTVKMQEFTLLDTKERREQEALIEALGPINKGKGRKRAVNMAYLLGKVAFKNIFSGRQSYEFAKAKAGFIERTLNFSEEITAAVTAKMRNTKYVEKTPAGEYLCYILNGENRLITATEVLELYQEAYRFGLPYIAFECVDYMKKHVEGEYIIDIFFRAEYLYDMDFLKELSKCFVLCYRQIETCTRCQLIRTHNPFMYWIVVDSVLRNTSSEDMSVDAKMVVERMKDSLEESIARASSMRQGSSIARVPCVSVQQPPTESVSPISVQQPPTERVSPVSVQQSPRANVSEQERSEETSKRRASKKKRRKQTKSSTLKSSEGKDISRTSAEDKISSQEDSIGTKNSNTESSVRNISKRESTEEKSSGRKDTASKSSTEQFTETSSKCSEEISNLDEKDPRQKSPKKDNQGQKSTGARKKEYPIPNTSGEQFPSEKISEQEFQESLKVKSPCEKILEQQPSEGKGTECETDQEERSKEKYIEEISELKFPEGKDASGLPSEEKISSQDTDGVETLKTESSVRNISKQESTKEKSSGRKDTALKSSTEEFTETSSKCSEEISNLDEKDPRKESPKEDNQGQKSTGARKKECPIPNISGEQFPSEKISEEFKEESLKVKSPCEKISEQQSSEGKGTECETDQKERSKEKSIEEISELKSPEGKDASGLPSEEKISSQDTDGAETLKTESNVRNIPGQESIEEKSSERKDASSKSSAETFTEISPRSKCSEISNLDEKGPTHQSSKEDNQGQKSTGARKKEFPLPNTSGQQFSRAKDIKEEYREQCLNVKSSYGKIGKQQPSKGKEMKCETVQEKGSKQKPIDKTSFELKSPEGKGASRRLPGEVSSQNSPGGKNASKASGVGKSSKLESTGETGSGQKSAADKNSKQSTPVKSLTRKVKKKK